MPKSKRQRKLFANDEVFTRFIEDALAVKLEETLTRAMKQQGFTATLKSLNRGRLPAVNMMTVQEGVVEELPSGRFDAALQTDKGRLVLRGAERISRGATDPQFVSSIGQRGETITDSGELSADQLIDKLTESVGNPSCALIATIEHTRFSPLQTHALLPLLWRYILDHRTSNDRDELVAVAAVTRKYIAIMPMDRMGDLALLLETGHRAPLAIDLEIEVAKMVYRNFEVHPSVAADPHPILSQRFWEIVQAYINPRVLLRDKHSAATSLAILAIVAMRSPLAEQAWQLANESPYRWFAELVSDDLDELSEKWSGKDSKAEDWLQKLRSKVLADV